MKVSRRFYFIAFVCFLVLERKIHYDIHIIQIIEGALIHLMVIYGI